MIAKGNVYGTPIVNIHIHRKFKTMQRKYIACIMVVQIKDILLFTILFLRSTNSYLSQVSLLYYKGIGQSPYP